MSKKANKLEAQPDGKIVWSEWMEERKRLFQNDPDPLTGEVLSPDLSYSENLALLKQRKNFNRRNLSATLQLLDWHQSDAYDLFFECLRFELKPWENQYFLRVVPQIHEHRAIDELLPYLSLDNVCKVVTRQAKYWPLLVLTKLLDLNTNRRPATILILELLAAHPDWLEPLQNRCNEIQKNTLAGLLDELLPSLDSAQIRGVLARQAEHWPTTVLLKLLALNPLRNQAPALFIQELLASHPDWVEQIKPSCTEAQLKTLQRLLNTEQIEEATEEELPNILRQPPWCSMQKRQTMPSIEKTIRHVSAVVHWTTQECSEFPTEDVTLLESLIKQHIRTGKASAVITQIWEHHDLYIDEFIQEKRLAIYQLTPLFSIETAYFALPIATLMHKNKWARPQACKWLLRFSAAAARGLIPAAIGKDVETSHLAQKTLHWLQQQGQRDIILQEAAMYGDTVKQAIEQILASSSADILPAKLPTYPKNIPLQILPRLLLKSNGHAIPLACIPDVFMTFLLSKADEPYIGLTWLQEAIQPDSFAKFGQALFKWWMQHDAPAKERWIFDVQGLIGNDETARMLNSALRQWRAALSRVRAYDAMNMLAQIGSDVALMYLDALAKQTRFNDLHERATRLITEVAEQRGLSAEQLADRTVPDLGLDERGMLMLDFGPRQFVLKFNESLQPRLEDSKGNVVKTLPKPNAKDHAELAKPASDLYKEVKKQAKAIASMQIKRLEAAMCTQRHWNVDEFMRFFVQHNLNRHLSQALVWGAFDEQNQLIATFRVAEDLTLTDANDDVYQPPDNAQIAIVHRLQLSTEQQQAFAQVLADYQKIQPFSQLAREVYFPVAEELSSNSLLAWTETRAVTSASLLGLEQRGWVRGVGEDAMVDHFSKSLDGLHTATLYVSPGWFVAGPPDNKEEHDIQLVYLDKQKTWNQVSAIAYSEVQRDLHLMAWFAA